MKNMKRMKNNTEKEIFMSFLRFMVFMAQATV